MNCAETGSGQKMRSRKLGLLLVIAAGIAVSCQDSDTTKVTPSSTTSPTVSETSTTAPSSTTEPPTSSSTAPPTTSSPSTTVTTEPILCDRYGHPLHHLTCEEADAQYAERKKRAHTTPTVTATAPSTRTVVAAPSGTSDSTLQNCIARYESENGRTSGNQYQFVDSTWAAYGGTGDPETAPMSEQNAVFERAWADGGEQHWAAQKGRCF